MSTPIKYLKDENGNKISPAVSVDSIFTQGGGKLVDYIYPIGSIYMSVNSTNPSQLFGRYVDTMADKEEFLYGVDTSNVNFETPEKTGGEETHSLHISEMPKHNHGMLNYNETGYTVNYSSGSVLFGSDIGYEGNINTSYNGSGVPHNNLQPYITCYMWKRTK